MRHVLVLAAALALASCDSPPPARFGQAPHSHPGPATTVPAQPLRPGERFLELVLPRPYTPTPAQGTDEYRCFLVDPGLGQPAFVTGSQFLPQNPAIVHHAILFRVPPEDVAQARDLDAAAPGDGWTCFGGTGIGGNGPAGRLGGAGGWIAAWAPGSDELVLEGGTGFEMAPGSRVVMQVHYNLLQTKGVGDRSGVRLRLMDGSAGLKPLRTSLVPAPVELPCAPGEAGPLCDRAEAVKDVVRRFGQHAGATVNALSRFCSRGSPKPGPVQSCDIPVPEAGTVHLVGGHMHLLGRSIKVELDPGTPRAKLLLDVPVYDFDNQGARRLPEPVPVRAGSTVRVTCTHDAALRRSIPALRSLPPRYVVWGDGTSDEMCLGILTWTRI